MELKINNLYGIKNELEIKGESKMMIFSPNGVGKTSITKGIRNIKNGYWREDLEKNMNPDGLSIETNESIRFEGQNNRNDIEIINHSTQSADINDEGFLGFLSTFKVESKVADTIENGIRELAMSINIDGVNEFSEIDFILNEFNTLIESTNKEEYLSFNEVDNKKDMDDFKKMAQLCSGRKDKTKDVFAEFYKKTEVGETVDKGIIFDDKIVSEIIKEDRQQKFKYVHENKTISLEEAKKILGNEIKGKLGKENFEILSLVLSNDSLRKNNSIKDKTAKGNTTFNSLSKIVENEYKTISKKTMANLAWSVKSKMKKHSDDLDKANKKLIDAYNVDIKKINKFFASEQLSWTIKIGIIKKLSDIPIITYYLNDDKQDKMDFASFASEGEKSILKLIIQLIASSKANLIVMDDVINSMDNHHIREFLNILKSEILIDKNLILFTHNYELLNTASHSLRRGDSWSFFIMDRLEKDVFKQNVLACDVTSTLHFKNSKREYKRIDRIITLINTLRETVHNYLLPGFVPQNNIGIDGINKYTDYIKTCPNKKLAELVTLLDNKLRHYKRNITIKVIIDELDKIKIDVNLPLLHTLIEELGKESPSKIYGDLIINDVSMSEPKSFDSYVMQKIAIGTKIRFIIEKYQYYSEEKAKVIQLWESEDQWSKAKPLSRRDKNSISTNYLAHGNGMQLNKIIEMPMYKIAKILKKAKE